MLNRTLSSGGANYAKIAQQAGCDCNDYPDLGTFKGVERRPDLPHSALKRPLNLEVQRPKCGRYESGCTKIRTWDLVVISDAL
jgi:hypothetical protein